MSVTRISQTETYNAPDVNAVIAQLLALDGSTTMTGTLLQSPLNVLRKAGQTGQEEIWYEYAGDPAYIQIIRNAYYSEGWKAKYPWDDGVNYLHPCRIIIGNYGKLYFEHAVGPSGGVDSAITWETGDINGRQFLSDAASGTPPFVVASATKVPNLNADRVDGYHAGNGSGAVPISNGPVNTNLNADMVDGRHAGNGSGAVPISNGTVNTNLNADMVDGVHGVPHVPQEAVTVNLSGNQNVNGDGTTYALVHLVDTATRCFDQNGNWTNAPTHKYTVPATGYYRVSYHNQQGVAGQDGVMRMKVYLNGAALNETQTTAHTGLSCGMSIILSLTLNSYIQLYAVYSDTVGNTLYANFCTMSIERIK